MTDQESVLRTLIGLEAWGARIGDGGYLSIEFGPVDTNERNRFPRGEFSIWIPGAPWRIEFDGSILVGSGQEGLETAKVLFINGDKITDIKIDRSSLIVDVEWRSGRTLRVFCENTDSSTIEFFLPHCVYSLEKDGSLACESEL
jgi:hypothetical protein